MLLIKESELILSSLNFMITRREEPLKHLKINVTMLSEEVKDSNSIFN